MFLGFNWVIIVFVHFFQVGKSLSASGYPIFLGMPNVRLHSYVAGRERSGRISVCWTFCHGCFNLTPGSPRLHQSASSLCHARLSGRTSQFPLLPASLSVYLLYFSCCVFISAWYVFVRLLLNQVQQLVGLLTVL